MDAPKPGDFRIVRKFLFLPKKLSREWRWLRRAYIHQLRTEDGRWKDHTWGLGFGDYRLKSEWPEDVPDGPASGIYSDSEEERDAAQNQLEAACRTSLEEAKALKSKLDYVFPKNRDPDRTEVECPACKAWAPIVRWAPCQVYCEDCEDDHDGISCPHCQHGFSYQNGYLSAREIPEPGNRESPKAGSTTIRE